MKTLSTKASDEFADGVKRAAERSNHSLSDFLRICIEEAVNGNYVLDGDRLVPTAEYLDALRPSSESIYSEEEEQYHEFHLDKLIKVMRDKKYPDRAIRDTVDKIVDTIRDNGKYDARRSYYDEGC